MRRQIAPKPHRTDRHTSDHGLFRPKALVQSTLTLSFGPPGAICTIARERTDETGDRAPLVELRHIDEHHRLFRVAQKPSLPQISSTGYPVAMAPQANPGAPGRRLCSGLEKSRLLPKHGYERTFIQGGRGDTSATPRRRRPFWSGTGSRGVRPAPARGLCIALSITRDLLSPRGLDIFCRCDYVPARCSLST